MNIYCFSTLSFAKLQFKSVINKAFHKHGVASFTDAWIETKKTNHISHLSESHLLQMRGLKHAHDVQTPHTQESHLLQMRGLKLRIYLRSNLLYKVASFTDAWIETKEYAKEPYKKTSHLLQMRGLKQD